MLASGDRVTASESEHPGLFWALRGGGSNFGVVTSFLFATHPIETVVFGPTLFSLDRSASILSWYRQFILDAPRELNGYFAFLAVPPVPPFPEELHSKMMCGVVWCYVGSKEDVEEIFAPVRELDPDLDGVQATPLPVLQSIFDDLFPPGYHWYWKSDFVQEIPDEAIEHHVHFAEKLPTPKSTMHLYPIDGAVHDVQNHETAWSHRDANWAQVIVGVDPDPKRKDDISSWAQSYWEALHPYSSGGAYANFMMEEGQDRIRASYRDNYDRLARIKADYDPENLFRINQNIVPA